MAQKNLVSRRGLIKFGGAGLLGLSATRLMGNDIAAMCGLTPRQPEGPFYPISDQPDKNTDLTIVDGKSAMALGKIIYLRGKVLDQNCAVVPKAVVEIWQACESGRYNHPGDEENPSPLDPNFQYWGIATTDSQGFYNFKTILPGHYEAGPGWIRPPHIHFKIHKRGFRELITQLYFAGNQYNNDDRILRGIPKSEWGNVVKDLRPRSSENGREVFDVGFDISIESLI